MAFTRTTVIRSTRMLLLAAAAALIIAYAIWRSLNYARGPSVVIFEPKNGSATSSSAIAILGRAERVNRLSLNGFALSIAEDGSFKENIVIFPGLNKLSFVASDQFGRTATVTLDLVGLSELPPPRLPEMKATSGTTTATSTRAASSTRR